MWGLPIRGCEAAWGVDSGDKCDLAGAVVSVGDSPCKGRPLTKWQGDSAEHSADYPPTNSHGTVRVLEDNFPLKGTFVRFHFSSWKGS